MGAITNIIVSLSLVFSYASASCPRDVLLATTEAYISSQTSGATTSLPLSTNFTYRENNKVTTLSKGVITTPLKIDLNRSTADTEACASYTMMISSTGSKPYVLATQITHDPTNTSAITMIDTIAATTGSLAFNAKQTLSYIQKEDWSPLPTSNQSSRALLKAVGDAYLDMWTNSTAADTIPWGTDCERVEGSSFTKPCGASLPHGGSSQPNSMRRYVVDETIGSVDVMCAFNSLGNYPDSHEIRLVNGKVKYVHTVTV